MPTAELQKLSTDLRKASSELDRDQARYLVDLYYQVQHYRIGLGEQIRSLSKSEEPHGTLVFFKEQQGITEEQLKKALDTYSLSEPLGVWAREQVGIGPVIAAGLLAHIDMLICQTAGQIWRFAGLDPTVKWYGSKAADELVKSAFSVEEDDVAAMYWLSRAVSRRMVDLYSIVSDTETIDTSRQHAQEVIRTVSPSTSMAVVNALFEERNHVDNAISYAADSLNLDPLDTYREIYGEVKVDKKKLIQALSIRPWNAKLKTLCWKIGESFTKQSGNENCYYGHIYLARKEYEQKKNDNKEYADQAEAALKEKNYGRDTEARKHYEAGQLPPARIQLRSQRYAVKLFLAHYFETGYELYNQEKPPNPYPIEHLGHVHKISPPGPTVAELLAA